MISTTPLCAISGPQAIKERPADTYKTSIIECSTMVFCSVRIFALTLVLLLTAKGKGCAGSKILSSPRHLYVLKESQGTIRCQNSSDDGETFYSYISDTVWYRHYDNGTNITISRTEAVNPVEHTLTFNPLLDKDQGLYFCCIRDGHCSNIMSHVMISTPPNITAIRSHYMAEVGSPVTVMCTIINQGVPLAQFRWIRDGVELVGENVAISHAVMALTLPNTTMDDAGVYTCSATSQRSYRSDHIILTVLAMSEATNVSNHSKTSSGELHLLVTFFESFCQDIKDNLSRFLSRHVREIYNRMITTQVKQTKCLNASTAYFKVNITGPGANETLQQILNDISFNTQGLNIGIGIIKACEENCTRQPQTTVSSNPSNSDSDDKKNDNFTQLIIIILLGIIALFSIITALCCLIVMYTRCRRAQQTAAISMPMHKCNVVPCEAKNQSYDKLQFHGDDCNRLTVNHQPEYLPVSSGYVEPNSINQNIIACFPIKPRRAATVESCDQKPVVMSTSNGTGIIRVGNLQAVIPSNHTPDDLDDLRIVPSLTHESYFDVVKQAA